MDTEQQQQQQQRPERETKTIIAYPYLTNDLCKDGGPN